MLQRPDVTDCPVDSFHRSESQSYFYRGTSTCNCSASFRCSWRSFPVPQAAAPKAPAQTPAAAPAAAAKGGRTIELTGGDDMKFNLDDNQSEARRDTPRRPEVDRNDAQDRDGRTTSWC